MLTERIFTLANPNMNQLIPSEYPFNKSTRKNQMCRFFIGVETDDAFGHIHLNPELVRILTELIETIKKTPDGLPQITTKLICKKL